MQALGVNWTHRQYLLSYRVEVSAYILFNLKNKNDNFKIRTFF